MTALSFNSAASLKSAVVALALASAALTASSFTSAAYAGPGFGGPGTIAAPGGKGPGGHGHGGGHGGGSGWSGPGKPGPHWGGGYRPHRPGYWGPRGAFYAGLPIAIGIAGATAYASAPDCYRVYRKIFVKGVGRVVRPVTICD
ncbi:hypothetical protein [Chelatococcus asaccharovorans]|uniref:hypothetical protein n=1 Tax=Chelatococcus asaccharovorans TaxID=28210 RepID=UPI00224C7BE1|nr:hypothetical protein [Chelatococcus asaccharovorans]CAH1673194.1 putative Sulfur globule protein CV2 [Chelatococcus asaccharovorans]CAH1675417.1 putative Sulfur globule protein CV2 [Chelatococcus asaccharovorans]